MTAFRNPAAWLPFLLGSVAVAGIVHIATMLAYPRHAPDDAFTRVAALVPVDAITDLPAVVVHSGLPSRDAAMTDAICRFDLGSGPLQITVEPFAAGFLSVGMHSRHGLAFYGLNLRANESRGITLVLMTDEERTKAEADDDDDPPQDLRITSPERQGFVLIEAPADDPVAGTDALSHVKCRRALSLKPASVTER